MEVVEVVEVVEVDAVVGAVDVMGVMLTTFVSIAPICITAPLQVPLVYCIHKVPVNLVPSAFEDSGQLALTWVMPLDESCKFMGANVWGAAVEFEHPIPVIVIVDPVAIPRLKVSKPVLESCESLHKKPADATHPLAAVSDCVKIPNRNSAASAIATMTIARAMVTMYSIEF